MKAKPAKLCDLKKGKLLDTQKGFVDTFNWMKDLLDELTKGAKVSIEEVDLVTEQKYSTKTHKFTIKTRKTRVIVLDSKAKDETIFEATAHSAEA